MWVGEGGRGWRGKRGWVGERRKMKRREERVELEGDYKGKKCYFKKNVEGLTKDYL